MSKGLTRPIAKNYVGGEWRDSLSGGTYEKWNPWRPSELTGVYPASDADDARAAVDLRSVVGEKPFAGLSNQKTLERRNQM